MAKVKALRQLHGDYGTVNEGETFEVADHIAKELHAAGLVAPHVVYDTKVITPEAPEVSARKKPFRDGGVRDEEPEGVDTEGDRVLPDADISGEPEGTAHPRGRRGHKGDHSK